MPPSPTPSATTTAPAKARVGTLLGLPAGLQLPSVSAETVAAMAALRFAHVSYDAASDAQTVLQDVVPAEKRAGFVSAVARSDSSFTRFSCRTDVPVYANTSGACRVGVEGIIDALGAHSTGTHHTRLDAGLSAGQLALNDGLVALIRATVFPAFEYAMLANDETYALAQPSLHGGAGLFHRLWDTLPAYRARKLKALEERFGLRTEADAVALAKKGIAALERALRAAGVNVASSQDAAGGAVCPFLHGSTNPSTADCFAFAALSVCATARVGKHSKWAEWQVEAGLTLDEPRPATCEFPLLMHYGRSVATRYFEQYDGLHFVNIPPADSAQGDDADPYRAGRLQVVSATIAFGFTYMLVANAKSILEALLMVVELAELEEGQEGLEEEEEEYMGGAEEGQAMSQEVTA